MAKLGYVLHRKVQYYQTSIAAEANTDAGATWGAPESTLANSLKAKINSILAALRTAGILSTTATGKIGFLGSLRAQLLQTNVVDEATADSDATYGQPEADLLNSMKTKVNSIITALRAAKVIGGRDRFRFISGRKARVALADISTITIANADATYTAGGAGEQGLANDIKAKVNLIITALDNAGVTA